MPLVDPVTSSQNTDLSTQLMGKKLGDKSDSTTFAKTDLPKDHRIIEHGGMASMDMKPERTNIHLSEDGTVRKVTKG